MWTDPIVEETRRIRDEHARKFNYDLSAIFADIKRFEASLPAMPTPRGDTDKTDAGHDYQGRRMRQGA